MWCSHLGFIWSSDTGVVLTRDAPIHFFQWHFFYCACESFVSIFVEDVDVIWKMTRKAVCGFRRLLLKPQTAFLTHWGVFVSAEHISIPFDVSPSDRFDDGARCEWWAVCLQWVCEETGSLDGFFSFLSSSPLTVTRERFIFLFIHLGHKELRRA